jgi:hypothetical protein
VLKKENFELPPILPDTPATTPVIAAARLANATPTPPESPKKRVRFSEDLRIRLFPITRARAREAEPTPLQLLLLEPCTELTCPIMPPKRTSLLLPPAIKDLLTKGYQLDEELKSILEALRTKQSRHKRITLAKCIEREGFLYYRDRLYVPNNPKLHAELLGMYHKSPIASYIGRS